MSTPDYGDDSVAEVPSDNSLHRISVLVQSAQHLDAEIG